LADSLRISVTAWIVSFIERDIFDGPSHFPMSTERHILEIPIYRIPRDAFYSQFERDRNRHLDRKRKLGGIQPSQLPNWEIGVSDRFSESYGAPWRYNQVVGWLRLFRLGIQLRADIWLTQAKRYSRRMAYKRLLLVGKGFEIWVGPSDSDADIVARLRTEFEDIERSYRSKRFVLDLECFNNLAPYVQWHELMSSP
jgi:hypothetical protein